MKKNLVLCFFLLIGGMNCAAAPGDACKTAIPVGKDFKATITGPKTVWYSAWTFDLPISVMFAPKNGANDPAPEVEMDFTCTPGYYADSILCSLFCKTGGNSGVDFHLPHSPKLNFKTLDDGTFVYYLSLGERYRNLLLQVGISYNVEVYVKVTFKSAGTLSIAPDNFFTNCMDSAKFMQINDTVQVKPKDKARHVVVPYVQWQEDTILYTWKGTKPCQLTVGAICDFDPTNNLQEGIVQFNQIQPGETLKVKADDIYKWVHNKEFPPQAGMYFAKFYSDEAGVMTITKAKQAPLDGNAILMRYGTSYALDANSEAVYAIPRSWNTDVQFSSPTAHLYSMVFSKTASFGANDTVAVYSYKKVESGRWLGIIANDMEMLWNKIPTSQQYLYIRFVCTEATSVTGDRWAVSQCYTKTANYTIAPGTPKTITKASSQVYRLSYPQWRGGDMKIAFSINTNCEVYLADTCAMTRTNANAKYWLKYKATTKQSAPLVIPASEIESWADRIDDEGCFYALFYTTANGTRTITCTTNAPEEKDPEYPQTTIAVQCEGTQVTVRVSEAQPIVITSATGAVVDQWEADTMEPHVLALPEGLYILKGKTEQIVIKL